MPEKWMSIVQAAAHLGCHTRTIERRIASGKIPSQKGPDGTTQVMLDVPDTPEPGPTAIETVKELAQDQVSIATGSASALVKFAQADAERARTELELVRQEAGRARQGARIAWSAVAAMAACVMIAIGWTTHRVTSSSEEIKRLNERAAAVEKEAGKLLVERDEARQQIAAAKLAEGEAKGRLYQVQQQSAKGPTTRPTTLVGKLAHAILNE